MYGTTLGYPRAGSYTGLGLSVGVELDAVAVGVGDLHADEPPVVLPLGLGNAGSPETLARDADGRLVHQPKPKWFVLGSWAAIGFPCESASSARAPTGFATEH